MGLEDRASCIPVHSVRRERGYANRNVLRSIWCRVLDPLALVRDHSLPCLYVDRAVFMPQSHEAFQHNRELVELWTLSWLLPASRAAHMRHACVLRLAIDAADVLIDQLRFGSRCLDSCGL